MAQNAQPASKGHSQAARNDAAHSSCAIKPHKPVRDANGQIRLMHLTEKGG
ncbi:MAG: hypothetical protein ACOX12_05505 [Eggerthellaceae bacterium]|jgi:hypothetical protein